MKNLILLLCFVAIVSCKDDYKRPEKISKVAITPILKDSTVSIRALEFNEEYLFYGASDHIGKRALNKELKLSLDDFKVSNGKQHFKNVMTYDDKPLNFRAIEIVNGTMFAVTIGNPARLYKLARKSTNPKLVYEELHENVFYDSMSFWNEQEGIAMGDPTDGCISIIITRDGGESWTKLSCDDLPKAIEGEAAFAASDTNITIVGDETWIATGGMVSRIMYSSDKGKSWEVYDTPIVQGKPTTGMYSLDFYDAKNGFAIGGDYTKPNDTLSNKIRTQDGGKTWQVLADGQSPGYRSCVQYIPNSNAQELVTVGFKGIDYSNDGGKSWEHLSDEGFYIIRFLNDSIAYAAGRGRISKLIFR
ncbi:WD40/YVTN/BNR-like repeat-containing protein [Winogradskyella haliclonae]|nr:oxidoreductase [Winogradskyella haliclonae]